ncbi:SIR2 family protein [Chloroflexota bacterium]
MWLISDKDKVFLNEARKIKKAQRELANAYHNKTLVLIVGNGPSQSAVFLDAQARGVESSNVGWASAILRAACNANAPEDLRSKEHNSLALAQAVFRQLDDKDASRRMILEELRYEFRRPIKPTVIHKLLVDLAPSGIVTTNYDLQIERAFEEQNNPWCALVRNVQDEPEGQFTPILKMHGTLEPDDQCRNKYSYAISPSWDDDPERSVVISETDYDECLYELMRTPESPLLRVLGQPCLIIGKSVPWQDLSFLYAL